MPLSACLVDVLRPLEHVFLVSQDHKSKKTKWPFGSFGHQEAGPSKICSKDCGDGEAVETGPPPPTLPATVQVAADCQGMRWVPGRQWAELEADAVGTVTRSSSSWAQSGFMTASPAVPRQAVILTLASSLESLPAGCVAVGTRLWGLISMMASPVGRGLCQAGRSDRQKEARLQSLAMR